MAENGPSKKAHEEVYEKSGNKHFLLTNRLVVLGLTAFAKSVRTKSSCAFFLPESREDSRNTLRGSCNNTLLRRFANSKCFLKGS